VGVDAECDVEEASGILSEATPPEEGLELGLGSKGVPLRIDHQQGKADILSLVGTLQPRVRRISMCQPGMHQGCGVWGNVPLA
jgi:hypothetical protein